MTKLNDEHKKLIFDYCMGLASPEQAVQARSLISSNEEATQIYSNLKATFQLLDSFEAELCPDELAERTILRVNSVARSSTERLQQLIAGEQNRASAIGHAIFGGATSDS